MLKLKLKTNYKQIMKTHKDDTSVKDVKSKLNKAIASSDILAVVNCLKASYKTLSKRESRILGVCQFGLIETLIKNGFISNDMNREEELDGIKQYTNKVHHLIRFVDAASRKSHLQLSFVPESGNKLFISDDGTMMSLCFGVYRTLAKISAEDWYDILNDISLNYEYDGSEEFHSALEKWIESLDEQQLIQKYSLEDVLRESRTFDLFNSTSINYEINVFNVRQHIKDQQNANTQDNPWIAHNFYKAPIKANELYKTAFCGDKLQSDLFVNVQGIGCNPKNQADRLFRNYAEGAKKTEKDIPFYTTLSALLLTNSIQEVLDANKFFKNYHKHEDSVYGKFWYDAYMRLVTEVRYVDMEVHCKRLELIQESGWADIVTTINRQLKSRSLTSCKAFQDLTPFKDDFGMYIIYVILSLNKIYPTSFSRTPSSNIKRIKDTIISKIIDRIELDSIFDIFDMDGATNWDARFKYVWEPAIRDTISDMENKSEAEKLFDKEVQFQKGIITKILRDNDWGNVFSCFSHQNDKLIDINMNDWTKTMAGLHCVSRDSGGTAKDGVIFGLTADNSDKWKYADLNEMFSKPSDYWKSLGDRNSEMLESKKDELNSSQIRRIKRFIELCDAIEMEGMEYFYKK